MRKIQLIIASALLTLTMGGCKHSSGQDHLHQGQHHEAEAELHNDHEAADHDHEADEHGEEGHHHDADEIILHRHEADEMGVETQTVKLGEFNDVISAGGQVLNAPGATGVVSAPTSGIVRLSPSASIGARVNAGFSVASVSARNMAGGDSNEANRIALKAAQTELDRVKQLYDERMATRQELNTAQAAFDAARNAASGSSSGAATAPVSGTITDVLVQNGSFVNQGDPIAVISSTGQLTVKADLPARYASVAPMISGANILFGNDVVSATKKSAASGTSTSLPGYIPVYFSVEAGSPLQPGSIVELKVLTSPRSGVISVPVKAVIERLGNRFVYCRIDDDCYKKVPVETGASDGMNIEIKSGLEEGMEIVTSGATVIRLAETSGAIPEGHSHHH
ncbi:MAG: efflux RND transporter periplasmic adaptor subunit [Muribaculaceae bacterium]|nr:efflux RND transporter periplasmic adaptor subunit [Muribaculaceae bacterium]